MQQQAEVQWLAVRDRKGRAAQLGLDAQGQLWLHEHGQTVAVGPKSAVRAEQRHGDAVLRLPDKRMLITTEVGQLRGWYPDLAPRRIVLSAPGWALFGALLACLLGGWLLVRLILPGIADSIAERIPQRYEHALQEPIRDSLEAQGFAASKLPAERQAHYQQLFASLLATLPEPRPYVLEIRDFKVPNAFALPGGIVVFTDSMFELIEDDQQFIAVAAHELGHLERRHILRSLLRASTFTLAVALFTGDLSNAIALANSAPAVLLTSAYSRDFEREADRYAFTALKARRIDPRVLGRFLQRMSAASGADALPGVLQYASSHPATEERMQAAEAAAQEP